MIIPFIALPVEVPYVTPQYRMQYHDSNHPEVWDKTPKWIRELAMCIRQHESHHNYRAKNPISTASGAYQFINATWVGNARWVTDVDKYPTAKAAPAHIQDSVFIHSIKHGGIHNWNGTGCGDAR